MFLKKKKKVAYEKYFVSYFYFDEQGEKQFENNLWLVEGGIDDKLSKLENFARTLEMQHKTDKIYFLCVTLLQGGR